MSATGQPAAPPGDIQDAADVRCMVDGFYESVLRDDRLASIFLRDAGIVLSEHLPRIRAYWEKLLLGTPGYHRHTMNIHRELHAKRPLSVDDFHRWLSLFHRNLDRRFAGPVTERARRAADTIAANMQAALPVLKHPAASAPPPGAARDDDGGAS